MESSSSQADPRPQCRYGLLCRRQNEEHWRDFSHSTSEPEDGNPSRVLLMLVGLPGSGKSTFCNKMIRSNPSKWRRICQDTISNGKGGSKEQCLKAAENALQQGINVMIDRCNATKEQRHEFLQLAKRAHVQAHALVLDLPVETCIQRALKREGHEGGLEGKGAIVAVRRMAKNKENPLELEGFSTVLACLNDDDVEQAFNTYHVLNVGNERGFGKSEDACARREESEANKDDFSSGKCIDKGCRVLAFPSISTSDFQFDHERAAEIIIEVAVDFLHNFNKSYFRLIFVDLKEDSDMLVRVRRKAAACGLASEKFMAIAGDITKLRSSCGLWCGYIANCANWRLRPGGGGVNAAIFEAAGEGLEIETKKRAKTLNPGSALVVPLPSTSPLFVNEGIMYIIHVLGPNMNPKRPNCLHGDYVAGCKLLRDTYSCMFRAFASHVESLMSNKPNSQSSVSVKQESPRDAFTVLMQSAKQKSQAADINKRAKLCNQGSGHEEAAASIQYVPPKGNINGPDFHEKDDARSKGLLVSQDKGRAHADVAERPGLSLENTKSKQWEPWAEALRKMMLHPEHHKDEILHMTNQAVVIRDKFPKSKCHFLVISRSDGLDSINDLNCSHLSVLHHMDSLGMTYIKSSLEEDESLVFRMGYHSEPSMRQLHMHVISQDFDSAALKNKKHWNSFTTPFFLDSQQVIEQLRKAGYVRPVCDEKALLKMELRCHRCRSAQPNIPRLKQHILSCHAPFPADLVQQGFVITAKNVGS